MRYRARRRWLSRLTLAELLNPFGEHAVARGFDVDEFDAHTNARLYDAHDSEACDDLSLPGESHAHASFQRQGLAGANKTTAERDIGSHAGSLRPGFQID